MANTESTNKKMIQLFLGDDALLFLLSQTFGEDECPRNSYVIENVSVPVTYEIAADKKGYRIESWCRDNSASKAFPYGEPKELPYGGAFSVDGQVSQEDLPFLMAGAARQMDRWFAINKFWSKNEMPDIEEGGVFVTVDNDVLSVCIVKGEERPDLKCFLSTSLLRGEADTAMARPYKDDIMKELRKKVGLSEEKPKKESEKPKQPSQKQKQTSRKSVEVDEKTDPNVCQINVKKLMKDLDVVFGKTPSQAEVELDAKESEAEKKAKEEEARRKAEEKKKAKEEEVRRKAEEKKKAKEEEARRKAEEKKKAKEEEARRKAEEKRKLEEKELARKENLYKNACEQLNTESIPQLLDAASAFESITGHRDATEKVAEVHAKIEAVKKKAEEAKKKKRNILIVILVVIVILIMLPILNTNVIKPNKEYRQAEKLFEAGQYEDAIEAFEDLYDYKDAEARVVQVQAAWDCEKLEHALEAKEYGNVGNYLNKTKTNAEIYAVACEAVYNTAIAIQDTDAATAQNLLEFLPKDFKDVATLTGTMGQEAIYQAAMEALNGKDYATAENLFGQIPGYKDADAMLSDSVNYQIYSNALALEEKGLVQSALAAYQSLPEDFADVAERIAALQPQAGTVDGEGATTPEGEAAPEGETTAEGEAGAEQEVEATE